MFAIAPLLVIVVSVGLLGPVIAGIYLAVKLNGRREGPRREGLSR